MDARLIVVALGLSLTATASVATATQTCEPLGEYVCTGDNLSDPYAHCDGRWVDAYGAGFAYVQVCAGHDGIVHLCVEEGYDGVPSTCSLMDEHVG